MAGNYYIVPEYQDPSFNISTNFTTVHNNTNLPYDDHQPTSNPQIPTIAFCSQSSSWSYNNSSASDEADENQTSIINERKRRRMISNRESARRSRMRRQKHLDELCAYVLWLRNENNGLMEKVNKFLETHEQVVQENDRLKKETIELRQLVSEAQLARTYTSLRDLDDHEEVSGPSCTNFHIKAQSTNRIDH
ncbi:hypothetical protein SSX86_007061 [Deinandra increscens subsp. villosa]|uniref:BZIP domain-containing protein n=1 Tax=Deinandra increscens subsp. villosa TaxID=3103831 RepID=A0AAP0DK45_9ASTR